MLDFIRFSFEVNRDLRLPLQSTAVPKKLRSIVGLGAAQVRVHDIESNSTDAMDIGTWDWSALKVSGGTAGKIVNFSGITGFSQ